MEKLWYKALKELLIIDLIMTPIIEEKCARSSIG